MVTKASSYDRPDLFFGISTDTKPSEVSNGSCFVEIDTSKVYFYNAEGDSWVEWSEDSHSGGNIVGSALVGTALVG